MSSLLPRVDFYTARDGRRLAVRVWNSLEQPRVRVVFLHGITSHGGWYTRSCHFLSGLGFEVHFLDRRGSGLNAADRGDVERDDIWLDDVAVYLEQACDGRPVVLGGISWGGKLAAAVASRHPSLIHALALLSPGLYSQLEPGALQRVALRIPATRRMQMRRFNIPLHPAMFTDTPRWREYVTHDPLALRDVTFRFAQADSRLTQLAREGATDIHMPILLMLSGRDRIVNNRQCRAFLARSSAVQKALIEYPDAAHTIEFEPEAERYFSDLGDWIGRTIAT